MDVPNHQESLAVRVFTGHIVNDAETLPTLGCTRSKLRTWSEMLISINYLSGLNPCAEHAPRGKMKPLNC